MAHKGALHGKTCNDIQEMLWSQKGINWNDCPTELKRGSCCRRELQFIPCENGKDVRYLSGCVYPIGDEDVEYGVYRNKWVIDTDIPIFTQDRDYVEALI